jgi:coenzyme PQQ synthesis protein D (PqqD)
VTGVIKLVSDRLEWREIDGEIVALDTEASKYLAGNHTAGALWPRLAAGATRDELLEALLARFDVDAETASRDLDTFLRSLEERGLIER